MVLARVCPDMLLHTCANTAIIVLKNPKTQPIILCIEHCCFVIVVWDVLQCWIIVITCFDYIMIVCEISILPPTMIVPPSASWSPSLVFN